MQLLNYQKMKSNKNDLAEYGEEYEKQIDAVLGQMEFKEPKDILT